MPGLGPLAAGLAGELGELAAGAELGDGAEPPGPPGCVHATARTIEAIVSRTTPIRARIVPDVFIGTPKSL